MSSRLSSWLPLKSMPDGSILCGSFRFAYQITVSISLCLHSRRTNILRCLVPVLHILAQIERDLHTFSISLGISSRSSKVHLQSQIICSYGVHRTVVLVSVPKKWTESAWQAGGRGEKMVELHHHISCKL